MLLQPTLRMAKTKRQTLAVAHISTLPALGSFLCAQARDWAERLRATVPPLGSRYAMRVVPEIGKDDKLVVKNEIQPAKAPKKQSVAKKARVAACPTGALVPHTGRVAYQEGLPYTQFVAALGMQLLLPMQRSAAAGKT